MRDYIVRSYLGLLMLSNAINFGSMPLVFLFVVSRPSVQVWALEMTKGDRAGALVMIVFLSFALCFLVSSILVSFFSTARFRKVKTHTKELQEVKLWLIGKIRRYVILLSFAIGVSISMLIFDQSMFGFFVLTPLALIVQNQMMIRATLKRA